MNSINPFLKPIRLTLGWTQEKLAATTGINRKTYTAYETGKRGRRKISDSFYKKYLNGTGIDLHLTIVKGHTIITGPEKLPARELALLLDAGAEIPEEPIDEACATTSPSNVQ